MRIMQESNFIIDFDHFQFLVGDKRYGPLVDTGTMWDKAEPIGVVQESSEIVGISTVRYGGRLSVSVRVSDQLESDSCSWNPIGKFEVDLPSGELILWGPESDDLGGAPVVAVSPGRYEAAAYSLGTEHVIDEMEPEGPDRYCIVLSRAGDAQPF